MAESVASPPAEPRTPAQWLTPPRFAALLALLVVAAFPDVVFGLRTFASGDFGRFGHPIAHFHREAFWRGEVPLWNPLNDFGLPFLAQWNTLTLYPGSLFYLLLPLSWSLGVFCLLHLWAGGVGMFLLTRRWTGNPLAAAFAGIAYAFSALALHSLLWPNNAAALGWLPWVVLAWERAATEGGRSVLLAALVTALQLLTGAPEIILQTWLLAGALALVSKRVAKAEQLSAAPPLRAVASLLPHPSPLPLGEGEPSSPSRAIASVPCQPTRAALPPLPAGEGRGEGERPASSTTYESLFYGLPRKLAALTGVAVANFFDIVGTTDLASQGFRELGHTRIVFCSPIAALRP